MAFIGFLKFLPISLYAVLLWQEEDKTKVLEFLPYFAVVLVVLSTIGAQINILSDFFVVAGRFSGFFQYPNTFALFLLICELLILKKIRLKIIDYISVCILIGGLLYTGSRTVFILFFISNFLMVLIITNKKTRFAILLLAFFLMVSIATIIFLFRDNAIISRYLNIGFGASTFVGRILYFLDALPLLIKHPFGMGYMGYFYIQNSIQTGIYNITYVHNDFLQFFLDIGIIPALLFIVSVILFFFKKSVALADKLVVATFCLHNLFDFNLQFIAMFFLFILLTDTKESKLVILNNGKITKPIAILVFVVNIFMAVSLILAHFGLNEIASRIYPYNTRSNLSMLEEESDLNQANKLADHILKQNDTYFAPYSVKAKYSYSMGDFLGVITNKNMVFSRYPFKYTEYKEYCVMLINGIAIFERQGDDQSALICKKEILSTYAKLEANKTRLSKLGSKIDEQPVLEFSSNVAQYIEQLLKEQVE